MLFWNFYRLGVLAAAASFTLPAASIVVLTGAGSSSLTAPLTAAGFSVINGTLSPGQIAANIAMDTVAVYIWNNGSLGNTGSPANPALAFNPADEAALKLFNTGRNNWIFDGLSWRANANVDEQNFTKNEALLLAEAGGGIVLGADDASGALIVQHVNQVAGWFGFNLWGGVYSTSPANHYFGGSFLTTPNPVNPKNVVGTTTYSEVPNGLQPNGVFLATAVFGSPSEPTVGFGSPALPSATFDGTIYPKVNHIVTTNITGGGIDEPVPEPSTLTLAGIALIALASLKANGKR
jgi:hypothetical protein